MKQSVHDGLYPVEHNWIGGAPGYWHDHDDPALYQIPPCGAGISTLGVQEIAARLKMNVGSRLTSSRAVVMDFNGDTQVLSEPVIWHVTETGSARLCSAPVSWLPAPPEVPEGVAGPARVKDPQKYREAYRKFNANTLLMYAEGG